jgi:hypothetical protein
MAFLDDIDRKDVWARFMAAMEHIDRSTGLTKVEFKAAIDAMDIFIANNATTINEAFPQPARSALTNVEKIGVFAWVALKRYGKEVL